MAIGDRQLKILQVIHAGHSTGEAIVEAVGSSMQMLSHYINQMVEDGYIKAARLYDNEQRDFIVVRAYLTPQGEAVLSQHQVRSTAPASPTISAPDERPSSSPRNDQSLDSATHHPVSDYAIVGRSLQNIGRLIADLPADWRDLAAVYLDDLQNEINIAYRRRPIRIRAYFLAMLRLLLPIVSKMPQGAAFLQQVRILSVELKIPVKLPDVSR